MVSPQTFDNSSARARLEAKAEAMSGETAVYEHRASDFQVNVLVKNEVVTGALKYATGVTEFGEGMQEGYFLALALKAKEGATIKTRVLNGVKDEDVTIEDGFCLYRITDPKRQRIQVTYEQGEDKLVSVLDLSQLVCLPKEG